MNLIRKFIKVLVNVTLATFISIVFFASIITFFPNSHELGLSRLEIFHRQMFKAALYIGGYALFVISSWAVARRIKYF